MLLRGSCIEKLKSFSHLTSIGVKKMPTGISKTIVAILLVIVIATSSVIGYIYYTSTLPKPTLTVYALWSGSEQYNFEQALGNFTQNTGINVTYYGYTTQDLLVSVPLQLKAPPYSVDVIIAPWPSWIKQLSPYLTPVNDVITASQFPTNIINPVKDERRLDMGCAV